MAKITIVGDAVVVTSSMKYEEIETIQKYRPQALFLMDEEGKEPVFAVGVEKGCGCMNKYGATFGGKTHDDGEYATITTVVVRGCDTTDIKEAVVEHFGNSIILLNKLEATLPAVLEEIKVEKETVLENIFIA